MKISEAKNKLPALQYTVLENEIKEFRPSQKKAIKAGLLEDENLLICTPTASGKTLIAEMASVKRVMEGKGKAVYIVPLKALANEKYKQFKKKYSFIKVGISSSDLDSDDTWLGKNDIIITTSEKLDSLIRHHAPWINLIGTIIVDEIHLLNDVSRGPTLEILLTILKQLRPDAQLIGLSATIGNPEELASWLKAKLVLDTWRPVELKQGIYFEGKTEYY